MQKIRGTKKKAIALLPKKREGLEEEMLALVYVEREEKKRAERKKDLICQMGKKEYRYNDVNRGEKRAEILVTSTPFSPLLIENEEGKGER